MNILVTGGASGLGSAVTRTLARNGAHKVFFTYCRSAGPARDLARDCPGCQPLACDFTDTASVDALLDAMDGMALQALVNNAFAESPLTHFHKVPPEAFMRGFLHSLLPTIRLTQKAITLFRQARFGRIVTVLTSGLINRPPLGMSEYTAAKAYLASLSRSWAVENAALGITANCVAPSFMPARMTSHVDGRVVEEMVARHPLQRLVTPEEVAEAVRFLLEASPHINGVVLPVNAAESLT